MADQTKGTADLTDGELLARHLAGEEAAFADLVSRHAGLVLAACRRALGPDDAEDAAQAVFVVLARKAAALRPEKSLAGWLHRTARMVSGTALRERSRRRLHEEEAAAMLKPDTRAAPALNAAERAELLARLDGAVEALPGRCREVVALCYLEGLSQSEAARRMAMPLGTVAVYCQRGLERLRERLGVRRDERLGAADLGALLLGSCAGAAAAVPAGFVPSTLAAAGSAAAVAPPVAALVEGVLKAIFWQKAGLLAGTAATVLALGVAAPLAVRTLAGGRPAAQQAAEPPKPPESPDSPPPSTPPPDAPSRDEDVWEVDCIDSHMEATWAGGTDMLLKVTELLLKHPDTDVPVASSAAWDDAMEAGKIAGKVGAAAAVDLGGKGEFALFVTSDAGDKVFAYDAKARKMSEVTAKLKLGSKSAAFAWGDFNGDGKLDLASSDGKGLTIWTQGADGSFSSAAVAEVPKEGCIGLAALDVGVKGRAGLVWSSKVGAPVVLVPDKEKAVAFALKALAAGPGAIKDPSGAGAALVADFDGDLIADVLQPYAKGSALYRGKGGAEFAEGAACDVALGDGRTGAFLGDWDFDGRIDVHTVGEDSPRLWQNLGKGKFENLFHISGELTYISKPGCIGGNAHDFNNDGRQDVYLTYPEMGAQVFFNRGYRSFGHAHKPTDLAETGNLPEALKGAQAGVLADLNGDGAQDMGLVLLDGTVTVLPQALVGDAPLSVRVALPAGGSYSGPVNVSATNDRRPLGAWPVMPGTCEALFCRADAGEVTITWQLPGGQPQKKSFTLENKRIRFVIGAGE